jgi:hypothetical protein
MAIATFNGTVLQVYKTTNKKKESVQYYANLFPPQAPMKEFTYEYLYGNLQLIKGSSSDEENDLLIHCIHALELSGSFE